VPSAGSLTPAFSSATTSYAASVANGTTTFVVTPTAAQANATVKINGVAVASGKASGPMTLAVGPNVITTVVTAQDGTTSKTYTLTVTRAASANADLASLLPSAGSLTPAFSSGTTSYTASVSNTTTSIAVTPTLSDASATMKVNGITVGSGAASGPMSLVVGPNVINTVVTSQDGTVSKTYTVTVTRAMSTSADLASLVPSAGSLMPAFSSGTTSYTASVSNTTTSIAVTPTLSDASATVTVNGITVGSGTASGPMSLVVGPNVINIVVTSQDGTVSRTYTLTVTRATSADADLAALVPSEGSLTPAFSKATTSYTASVPNTTTSITVIPTVSDENATVTVNGTPVASGASCGAISLVVGSNVCSTVVTAQDGTTKTYTLIVTRSGGNDANLTSLVPGTGTMTPAFSSATTSYVLTVPDDATSVRVTPTVADVAATVKVNGNTVVSGSPSSPISIGVGPSTINTVVTSQDGIMTKSYTLTITRAGTPDIAGSYNGLATPTARSANPARHVGLGAFMVASTGTFTGKLTLGGSPTPIVVAGTFGTGKAARFNGNTTSTLAIERKGQPTLSLALSLELNALLTSEITGTLTENGSVVSTILLDRALYTAINSPTPPLMNVPEYVRNQATDAGKYTGVFQALTPQKQGLKAAVFPQGDGYALMNVVQSGGVMVIGRLGDGEIFTYFNYLSKDNVLPLYLTPYAGAGTVSGPVSFRDVPMQSDADGLGLRWFKPANPSDPLYSGGWQKGIKVDFVGSKFVPPSLTGTTVLGNDPTAPSNANALLTLSDGGLRKVLSSELSLNGDSEVTVLGTPSGGTATKDLIVTTSLSNFGGSFTHSTKGKTTVFAGVVLQKTQTASGYFLGQKDETSAMESGAVTISGR
jgi:hypothetical protein